MVEQGGKHHVNCNAESETGIAAEEDPGQPYGHYAEQTRLLGVCMLRQSWLIPSNNPAADGSLDDGLCCVTIMLSAQ